MRRPFLLPLLLAASLCSAAPSPEAIVKAIGREIGRAADSLVAADGSRPYYLSVRYVQTKVTTMRATFGESLPTAVSEKPELMVEVRVGTPELDDSRFEGTETEGFPFDLATPADGDPVLLRRQIWALFDDAFRQGSRNFAEKRHWLSAHPTSRKPGPDFILPEPIRHIDTLPPLKLDTALWNRKLAELSDYANAFPGLIEAPVELRVIERRQYSVNNLGSVTIDDSREYRALAPMLAQAEDGAPLWDYWKDAAADPGEIDLKGAKEKLAERARVLLELRDKAPEPPYRGPVMIEGEAAAQFLLAALGSAMLHGEQEMALGDYPNPMTLLPNLGHRILPKGFALFDLPGLTEFDGRSVVGHYAIDGDGQRARDIEIVKDGILNEIPTSQAPLFGQATVNGHGSGGFVRPGPLALSCPEERVRDDLEKTYREIIADEGNDGLVIERFSSEEALNALKSPLVDPMRGKLFLSSLEIVNMPFPLALSRMDKEGRRTPIRPLDPSILGIGSYRDWMYCGRRMTMVSSSEGMSSIAPSLVHGFLSFKPLRITPVKRMD